MRGGVIRPGFDPELDELRSVREGGVDWIARLQATERERTGIGSLKVGFNRVFGYYIEVTRTHLDRVPEEYQRRQTLTGAERYITPELKEWEEKVLGAEERILALETRLFEEVRRTASALVPRLQTLTGHLAALDEHQKAVFRTAFEIDQRWVIELAADLLELRHQFLLILAQALRDPCSRSAFLAEVFRVAPQEIANGLRPDLDRSGGLVLVDVLEREVGRARRLHDLLDERFDLDPAGGGGADS